MTINEAIKEYSDLIEELNYKKENLKDTIKDNVYNQAKKEGFSEYELVDMKDELEEIASKIEVKLNMEINDRIKQLKEYIKRFSVA